MSLAAKAYAVFRDDEAKAQALSEIFEIIEEKISDYSALARSEELKESQLKLQLEIEKNRTEIERIRGELDLKIEQTRSDLQIEIEKNRAKIEQTRSDLQIEIEKNRALIEKTRSDLQIEIERVRSDLQIEIEKNRTEIEKNRTEIEKSRVEFSRLLNRQLLLILSSISVLLGLLKGLDYLLKYLFP